MAKRKKRRENRLSEQVEAPADFDIKKDVCFIGMGATAVCYYRCMLPAMALGADWMGLSQEPPHLHWDTGLVKDEDGVPQSGIPDLGRYKIVVIQQPAGPGWLQVIRALQENGTKVVYEVDDYLHGIKHLTDHSFKDAYTNIYLARAEAAMKACDALIGSTEWITGNYSHFNRSTYLCRNGLDIARYDLTKPDRPTVNVGWAGATGHTKAVIPWFQQVANIMRTREDVCFVSIGEQFAKGFEEHFGPKRSISVPWAAIEQYPAAMTMFDIALAPGGSGGWWRGKSDLRWLESGALGIPAIVNPNVYPDVVDGETGMVAHSPHEMIEKLWLLLHDEELRTRVGDQARRHIRETRDITFMADQWRDAFNSIVGRKT